MTVEDIKSTLSSLPSKELHQIEGAIHELFRSRGEPIIYDDAYGVWTEADQASAADEAFSMMDAEEMRDA